jgi:hypothetical protein
MALKNTGIPYEILVQQIFQDIVDTKAARTIEVKRDVTLPGKSVRHQIDVYWEFELGVVLYKTVVQAKDWSKPVDKGELIKFKGVLDDLPGQPRGVVVTRKGYQSGAAQFAKAHDILLFELTELNAASGRRLTITTLGYAKLEILGIAAPVKGESPKLIIRGTPFEPRIDRAIFEADQAWMRTLPSSLAEEVIKQTMNYTSVGDCSFYDDLGNAVGDLYSIYRETVDEMRKEGKKAQELAYRFAMPTFIATGSSVTPYLKINGLSADITIEAGDPVDSGVELPNIATFILRNVATGATRFIQTQK